MIYSVLFFIAALIVGLVLTPFVIRISQRGIGLDHANETRKTQAVPISRLGGVPIMAALLLAFAVILLKRPHQISEWLPLCVGLVLIFILGLWDDLKTIRARWKLVGQIGIALLVYFMGLSIDRVTYPLGVWSVQLGGWSLFATVFWLITVPNIVNLIDGFDGLAGGLGMFMALTLGIVALYAQQLPAAWVAFAMAGALLGFLCFNFPPARIYLGDGGAYMIGFFIAGLSLTSSQKGSIAAVLLVTVVALGIPILDTSMALVRRALRGFPLFHADDEHIHHKLEKLGFSKRRIVLGMYGVCVVLSVLGLSIIWSQGQTIPIAIGAVFLLALFALRYLLFVKTWRDAVTKMDRMISQRRVVHYALLQAQVLDMEVDRCRRPTEFWPIFHQTLHRVGFVDSSRHPVDESYCKIEVRYNGTVPWTLHAPLSEGSLVEWRRIAECFRPVYVKAKAKWR